jgi:hypothetical protein
MINNTMNTLDKPIHYITTKEEEMKKNGVENIETVKDPPKDSFPNNSMIVNTTQEEINELLKQPIHSDAKPTQCDKWNERQLAREMAEETNIDEENIEISEQLAEEVRSGKYESK